MIVPLSGHVIAQKWFSKSVRLFFWYHLCDIYDLQCIIFMFSWYSICWGSQETNLKDIKNVKSRNEPNGFVSIESKQQNHRLTCRRFVGAPQMYSKRLGMLLEILDFSYVKMFKQVLKIVPSRELTYPSRGKEKSSWYGICDRSQEGRFHMQHSNTWHLFLKSTLLVLAGFCSLFVHHLGIWKRSRDSLFQTMHSKELGRGPYSAFLPNNHLEHEGAPSCPSASRRMFITPLKNEYVEPENDGFPRRGSVFRFHVNFWCKLARRCFSPSHPNELTKRKGINTKAKMLYTSIKTSKGFNFRTNVNGNHVNTQHSGRWHAGILPIHL